MGRHSSFAQASLRDGETLLRYFVDDDSSLLWVVQQGQAIRIWGWADAGEEVVSQRHEWFGEH